jgi:hypothetical protein
MELSLQIQTIQINRDTLIASHTLRLSIIAALIAIAMSIAANALLGGSEYPQLDVRSLSKEQVAEEVRRRDAADSKWEWKMSIRFYGKVIDDNSESVPDARVHFQWTDSSGKGTSEADTTTDKHGLFYLDNVQGKRLLVRVTKPGYYSSDARNRLSFEFANPFEEIYYQPKPTTPVLFYLRKQRPGAELIRKSWKWSFPATALPL